jgi:small subunit ribosomal protein S18
MAMRRNQSSMSDRRDAGRPKRSNRKVCTFCVERVDHIDYKEVSRLRRFLSERGKILPRRITGTCARHQRPLTDALKRARSIALLPFTTDTQR